MFLLKEHVYRYSFSDKEPVQELFSSWHIVDFEGTETLM